MVTLATAHPAKFPAPVRAATGVTPQLPASLAGELMARPEHFLEVGPDLVAVQALILEAISGGGGAKQQQQKQLAR
jgi:threonine synthase